MNYNNYNNNNTYSKIHSFHWRSKSLLPPQTTSYAAATAFFSQNQNQNQNQNQGSNSGVCSNCGKFGHLSYQCNHPTVSYGTIVYRVCPETKQREYLMICRKDSFGYVDFIRGKYSLADMDHVYHIFREMSCIEHERIKNAANFNELWCNMWNVNYTKNSHKHEERMSKKKYEILKGADNIDAPNDEETEISNLDRILAHSSNYKFPEWEFPKGRKEFNETEIDCALREFEEETGIPKQSIQLIDNVSGFDENYVGTNYVAYKHRYFLARMDCDVNSDTDTKNNNKSTSLTNFQQTEVSRLEWKTLDQCMQDIRPYHLEKKQLLKNIDAMIQQYLII